MAYRISDTRGRGAQVDLLPTEGFTNMPMALGGYRQLTSHGQAEFNRKTAGSSQGPLVCSYLNRSRLYPTRWTVAV